MRRCISAVLAVVLLLTCVLVGTPKAYAAPKAEQTRAIAIAFDNSGSMYMNQRKAWSQAIYAMEVFASMLNEGDTLQIYPMHEIQVGGQKYTMDNPYTIKSAKEASTIRDIYTTDAQGTPIEVIDRAAEGVAKLDADKKYMIVLTDGAEFYMNDRKLDDEYAANKKNTRRELDSRFQKYANENLTVMFLGIENEPDNPNRRVTMPDTAESANFVKMRAATSAEILSTLTTMCNKIFGRDSLPKNHINGKTIDFDLSIKKLIVFVQGENVSGLKLTGNGVGQQVGSASTKHPTHKGTGRYSNCVTDTSLQGMIVTYTDCAAGTYNIEFSGTASSIEVYYEPDADLSFVFTDSAGNTVDPSALYEGDYKVTFGLKDAKTGKLITSDLLGKPHYQGTYTVNGETKSFSHDGHSGEVPISLLMDETFEANLTVTYLSGYTITKDSTDFGWPKGGIKVSARPAGDLELQISGGSSPYSLQTLEEGEPYIVKVFYQGTQLTGDELKSVELKWSEDSTNAKLEQELLDDHIKLSLRYKDPSAPQNTACGDCTVILVALYTAQGSDQSQGQAALKYSIDEDNAPLKLEVHAPQDYIVIKELDKSEVIKVTLKLGDAPLTAEEFAAVALTVDTDGIEYDLTPNPEDSSYTIKLKKTAGISERDYPIKVSATYTDLVGRETKVSDSANITLSSMPLWLRWLIRLGILLALIIIIWIILHIKVLPKYAHISKRESRFSIDGDDQTKHANFDGKIKKDMEIITKFHGGKKVGFALSVKPGKESYLYKKQKARYAESVDASTIRKIGTATIDSVMIGSVKYIPDEKGKLVRTPASKTPLKLKHGMNIIYSGEIVSAGVKKPFNVTTKLNFNKKK